MRRVNLLIAVALLVVTACGAGQVAAPTVTLIATFPPAAGSTTEIVAEAPVPTNTAGPTNTPKPTEPPRATNTPKPTKTPAPTKAPKVGTRSNPVAVGTGYDFPGYGPMKVTEGRYAPGTTGIAIANISFTCTRPSDQSCSVLDFLLDAIGSSGTNYEQEFSSSVPEPSFWDFMTDDVYGGGTKEGYAGFLIKQPEDSVLMRVSVGFSSDDPVFFVITK